MALARRRQFATAERDIRKAIQIGPASDLGYAQMGNLRREQKKFAEAEKAYRQALERNPISSDALAGLANTYLDRGMIDRAIAVVREQIEKQPQNSRFYDLLGTLLSDRLRDLEGAKQALRRAVELDESNADAVLKLGQVLATQGATEQAIALYQHFVDRHPRRAGFQILLGELFEARQQWDRAKQSYEKALTLESKNAVAANNLAAVMLESGGNPDSALTLAETARRGMPGSSHAADTLGWAYFHKGAYNSAADLFEEALRLAAKAGKSDDATIRYHLALAYRQTGKARQARQQLQKALADDPNFREAAEVRNLLAGLQ